MITKIKLNPENKFWILGALIALCMSLFTLFVVRSYAEKSDEKHRKEIADMRQELVKQAIVSQAQAEVINAQNVENYKLNSRLENKFDTQAILLQAISKNYEMGLIEINKIKNEKVYIPLDVSVTEQHKFLSDYIYKPY